ncbi:MAG: ABC transporter permease [Clostridiales bacterium GWC2_40_7]|nr:MAG: ABC transporter permease [Clostridiales bacterium GWC2_40_7]
MKRNSTGQTFLWIILLFGTAVFIFPFIFMISNSFEDFTYVLPNPPRLLPKEFVLSNYMKVLKGQHIATYFANSVIITLATTALGLIISTLSAYGFAKIKFMGRETLFKIYLFTLMVPGVLSIIPQFGIINSMGLIGHRAGLILLYTGTGICGNTFFLRSFFQALPDEIGESVVVDGGSHFTIYSKIIVPLSKAGIATLSILTIQGTWDDFFTAKVILGSNNSVLTLPVMVQRLHGQFATKWGLVFAAAILMLVPILVLYIAFQKYFVVGGLTEGGIKM